MKKSPSPCSVVLLGSGGTKPTPIYGAPFPACHDGDPKSARTRFGLLLRMPTCVVLIDPNPDVFRQSVAHRFCLGEIGAIVITHAHFDHLGGLGEFFVRRKRPVTLWYPDDPISSREVGAFSYLEREGVVEFRPYSAHEPFDVLGARFLAVPVDHGFPCFAFRIEACGKSVAVLTDTSSRLADSSFRILSGADLLFVDAFSENLSQVRDLFRFAGISRTSVTREKWFHLTFPQAVSIARKLGVKQAVSIHMCPAISPHRRLVARYQSARFQVGYDGWEFSWPSK